MAGVLIEPDRGRFFGVAEVLLPVRECLFKIQFDLMVSVDCEPKSASHEFRVLVNYSRAPHVDGKNRFRILRGLGLPRRLICARRKLGNGKCANHDNRSQRSGEMHPSQPLYRRRA